ncbi:MAG: hypothetical protein M1531_07010 [Chloroflexi bacterium]|nr:hypothetical protein [Chloroflexota bacterium]
MTNRERVLAILARKSPDRIPWLPRLKLWYEAQLRAGTMPKRFAGMSLRELERAVGTGTPARDGKIFKQRYENVEVVVTKKGNDTFTEYRTPVGTLTEHEYVSPELAAAGLPGRHQKYLTQGLEDYKVWEYIAEHTYYDPTYEEYIAYERDEIDDEGFPLVSVGDVPFHYFLLHLAGYNDAYLQLADHTEAIEHMFKVMYQVDKERLWPAILNSPATLVNHGSHFDSRITPPPYFRKYITPYYREFSALLHAKGKYLSYHADNDNHLLLPLIPEAGYDMGECFASWPMNRLTTGEAYKAWYPTKTIIWGGIPSVAFSVGFSDQEFEDFMDNLFKSIAPGDNIILGIGDNLMPGHKIERVERVSQLVRERGNIPIKV